MQLLKRVDPPQIALVEERKHRRVPTGWPEGIEIGHTRIESWRCGIRHDQSDSKNSEQRQSTITQSSRNELQAQPQPDKSQIRVLLTRDQERRQIRGMSSTTVVKKKRKTK
jgi:hypothetical protein